MKRFIVTTLFMFSTLSALAGFDRTQIKLGEAPRYTTMTVAFKYQNTIKTPTVLTLLRSTSEGNVCKVSNYNSVIKPGKSGTITVSCSFRDIGFNNKEVAFVQILEGKNISTQSLRVQAQVIEQGTCNEMDLNYTETLAKMPVLDQDGMGICYAFASSQLIEFHLRQKGYKKNLSAIDASFLYKSDENSSDFVLDSGYVKDAINSILKEGVASRECINKVIRTHTYGTPLTSEEFLAIVERIYKARRSGHSKDKIKKDLKPTCDSYGISMPQLDDLMKQLNKPFKQFVTDLFSSCEKERNDLAALKNLEYDQKEFGTDKSMGTYLNKILDQRIPAALSMCAEVLKGKPNHRGLSGTMIRSTREECGNHAVLVTAKRTVKNKCQYLVRNSWGGTWNPKSLSCACKTQSAYYPDCSKAPKNIKNKVMVGCWVDANSLLPNTSKIGSFAK